MFVKCEYFSWNFELDQIQNRSIYYSNDDNILNSNNFYIHFNIGNTSQLKMSTEMWKIKRINNSIENIEYSEIFKHKTTLFDEDELIIPIRYWRTVDTSFKDISYLSKDLNSSWFLELASKTKQIIWKWKSFTEINNANTICQHIQKLVECRLYEASFYPYWSNNSEELSSVKPEEDHNQQLENIEVNIIY